MRFFLFLIPTILVSMFVFLTFGFLGFCGMGDCLGSGNPSAQDKLLGAGIIFAASLPLVASSFLLYMRMRKKRLSSPATILVWAVILIIGALGIFQVLVDPGDAIWAGVPLIVFSALFVSSLRSIPTL